MAVIIIYDAFVYKPTNDIDYIDYHNHHVWVYEGDSGLAIAIPIQWSYIQFLINGDNTLKVRAKWGDNAWTRWVNLID